MGFEYATSPTTPAITGDTSTSGRPEDTEFLLLNDDAEHQLEDELDVAPIFSREAYIAGGYQAGSTQYGVLGKILSVMSKSNRQVPDDPRLYVNTNAPFSAVICGVQGSGKSHTLSVLLENMFVSGCSQIGVLNRPLSGLVLHYGEVGSSAHPSEAAHLAMAANSGPTTPAVHVFVSKSSLATMKALYARLGSHIVVEPLYLTESELDAQAFLSMMAVGTTDAAPLYMQIVLSILRDLGESYTYRLFIERLESQKTMFNPAQKAGLEQRMSLLTAFLPPAGRKGYNKSRFAAGQLTIVDLSDPFIDPASACGLFEVVTRLFLRADVSDTGKVLVVDEAHKYLSPNPRGSSGLTKALLEITRQQRHLGMRVIISTQEPTVIPPMLLDLCTVTILHRFSSPAWWQHLIQHVSANFPEGEAFDQVVKLKTGQAMVLAPSGMGVVQSKPTAFGRSYLIIKMRQRVTDDGGASVLVLPKQ